MNKSRLTAAMATVTMLAESYPLAFVIEPRRRRPLKIGIRHDVIAALDGAVAPKTVSDALRLYTGNPCYLKSCKTGADRIDLNGNPVGQVSAEDAASAKIRKKAKEAKWRERKQLPAKPVVVEPVKPPEPTRRISLADLRVAARSRRAVA
jgi:ProP effector